MIAAVTENLARGRELRLASIARIVAAAGMEPPMAALEAAYERSGAEMRARFWSVHRDAPIGEQVRLFLDCIASGLADRLSRDAVAAAVEAYASPVLLRGERGLAVAGRGRGRRRPRGAAPGALGVAQA